MRSPSALAALLGAAQAKSFLRERWPDEHLLVHRGRKSLPAFFREGPLSSFASLAEIYDGRVQIAGGRGDDHLQFSVSDAPPAWLRQVGLPVFFGDDVSPCDPAAAEWLRALEAELGAPKGIGAIRTFASPGEGGLEFHYDQGETFIVQLEGTKQIRLARTTPYPTRQFRPGKTPAHEHYPEFGAGFPNAAPGDGPVVELRPGSVLYIPRGMWHRTEASSGASFSASVCVDTPNAIDVLLPYLRDTLRSSPEWRKPLFGAWGQDRSAAREQLTQLLAGLGPALASLDADAVLDAASGREAGEVTLRAGTRLQRCPTVNLAVRGLHLAVTTRGAPGEVRILLSKSLVRACRWLARREAAFTYGELRAANGAARQSELETLVRSLLEVEALKLLPFEQLSGAAHDNSSGEPRAARRVAARRGAGSTRHLNKGRLR